LRLGSAEPLCAANGVRIRTPFFGARGSLRGLAARSHRAASAQPPRSHRAATAQPPRSLRAATAQPPRSHCAPRMEFEFELHFSEREAQFFAAWLRAASAQPPRSHRAAFVRRLGGVGLQSSVALGARESRCSLQWWWPWPSGPCGWPWPISSAVAVRTASTSTSKFSTLPASGCCGSTNT